MKINTKTGEWENPQDRFLCSFGIIEGIGLGIAGLATDAGVGAAAAGTIGSVGAGVLTGAAGGAALGGITGGDPGLGALTGGLTGGALGAFGGAGGALDSATGGALGGVGSDAVIGGVGGVVGSGITGSNPLTGAITGAAGGAVSAGLGDLTSPSGAAASGATAPGASAASVAPPAGVGGAIPDLTGGTGGSDLSGGFPGFGGFSSPTAGSSLATPTSLDSTVATAAGPGTGGIGATPGITPTGTITSGTGNGGLDDSLFSTLTTASGSPSGVGLPGSTIVGAPAPAAPAAGAPAGPAPNSIDTAWNNPTGGNILKAVGNNLGPLVAGGGLLANLLTPNNVTGISELKGEAGQLLTQGGELSSYLQSGRLPPGAQASLDQATNAAKANVRSRYAALGMSGSTAEAQDLDNVGFQAQAQSFQIADNLLKTGIDETGLASNIYESLANIDQQQSAATGSAIASLAAALSGGTTIRIGA